MTSRLRLKRTAVMFGALLLVVAVAAYAAPEKKDKRQGRLLFGKVLDQHDDPVPRAIVYLTDTRTHAVKTYIAGADGGYRFPGLSVTADYEVYAQRDSEKSEAKSVSQFDDRPEVYIDLKIASH
jgi:hypothetical protein